MNTNTKKEWNDDDRDTKDYIQHYTDGFDRKHAGVNSVMDVIKEVVHDEYARISNIHWNEVEYRSYANEPMYVLYEESSGTIDDVKDNKPDTVTRDDENDLTYQGLVKNKFMYA